VAVAQTEHLAELRKPSGSPDPVCVQRIDKAADDESIDDERLEVPAFRHRAGRDRRGRIHEHHLEQEEREDRSVIGHAGKEKPGCAEKAEILAEQVYGEFVRQECGPAAEARHAADAAHLEREAADPIPEHAERIDHEVHGHGVPGVLCLGEARLNHGEPGLHEHDQETRHEGPDDVDSDAVVAHDIRKFRRERFFRTQVLHIIRGGRARRGADHVPRAAGIGARRIGLKRRCRRCCRSGWRRRSRLRLVLGEDEAADDGDQERQDHC
jgi:hypothetical protein